jgi:hypothetical protein
MAATAAASMAKSVCVVLGFIFMGALSSNGPPARPIRRERDAERLITLLFRGAVLNRWREKVRQIGDSTLADRFTADAA